MRTVNNLLIEASKKLIGLTATPNLDADLILCHVLDWSRIDLISKKYDEIPDDSADYFEKLIQERVGGKPVQYIVGVQEFMGLDFEVSEDVLIPRPDTEILIETILNIVNEKTGLRILDIGTGSGAIPIALASFLKDAKIW